MPRNNNLDILRLLLSLQVVLIHMKDHLGLFVPSILSSFSGVPGFFFISGMLVYVSCMRNPLSDYAKRRVARIFPGLFLVSLGALGYVLTTKGSTFFIENFSTVVVWFFSQVTLGQAYNPSIFRDLGVGVVNGSLWTITVEVLFYSLVPLLVVCQKNFRGFITCVTIFSLFAHFFLIEVEFAPIYRDKSIADFFALTPLYWGWMFGVGILCSIYFEQIEKFVRRWFWLLLAAMMLMIFADSPGIFETEGNQIGYVYFLIYALVIFWVAFCLPPIRLPFDISYGVYLWHMIIINFAIDLRIQSASVVFLLILIFGYISWTVERRFI